jgi:hypothetical protein
VISSVGSCSSPEDAWFRRLFIGTQPRHKGTKVRHARSWCSAARAARRSSPGMYANRSV